MRERAPMSKPTTSSPSRPASIFAEGGEQWTAVPVSLHGPAAEVFRALMRTSANRTETEAPDRVLQNLTGRSRRYVQMGLRSLEQLGWIERIRRHGGRLIRVLKRLAGHAHGKAQPMRRHPAPPMRTPCPAPSYEGLKQERKGAVKGLEGPPAREPEQDWSHLPAFRRWFGRLARTTGESCKIVAP